MGRAKLGQHFLIAPAVPEQIVAALELSSADRVLEIGPGRGALTKPLSARAGSTLAVEIDAALAERLGLEFAQVPTLSVVCADFLKWDLSLVPNTPVKIAGNLPYSAASPILQKVLSWPGWSLAVLMFQKEVAERLIAEPGSRKYGLLSLSVMLYAESEIILEVPREAFDPKPQVASAVVRLKRRKEPLLSAELIPDFFRTLRAAFSQRRKKVLTPFCQTLKIDRKRAEKIFKRAGVDPSLRAEQISFESYARLTEALTG